MDHHHICSLLAARFLPKRSPRPPWHLWVAHLLPANRPPAWYPEHSQTGVGRSSVPFVFSHWRMERMVNAGNLRFFVSFILQICPFLNVVHPPNFITWPLKAYNLKKKTNFQTPLVRGHVNMQGWDSFCFPYQYMWPPPGKWECNDWIAYHHHLQHSDAIATNPSGSYRLWAHQVDIWQ